MTAERWLEQAAVEARAGGLGMITIDPPPAWLVGRTVEAFVCANLLTKVLPLEPIYETITGEVRRVNKGGFVLRNDKGSVKCLWSQLSRVLALRSERTAGSA